MRIASLVLLVVSTLQFSVNAQDLQLPSAAECVTDISQMTDENCYRPSMSVLIPFFMHTGRRKVSTSVHVTYDEKGHVTAATLNQSTRDKKFDAAIVEWAKLMKLMPGTAGEGDLPIDFSVDG